MELTTTASIQDYFFGGLVGAGSTASSAWLNTEKIVSEGANSLSSYIRGVVARDVGLALIVSGKTDIDPDLLEHIHEAVANEDINSVTSVVKAVISVNCHKDEIFFNKFRIQVDTHVAQIVAALPHVAEQALMQELWDIFQSGLFVYDTDAEGDFDGYLDNILSWLGDHSASKKSDLSFLIQKVFPFCVAKGIPIQGIIGNISKSRTAVPVLRTLYEAMESGKIQPSEMHEKYLELVNQISNKSITNVAFTGWLKASGLKGSYFNPMLAFDWASGGSKGSIIVNYNSLSDRTRIVNKLGNIVKELEYNPSQMTHAHYGVWAGTVIQILMTYGKGMVLNPEWDGKEVTELACPSSSFVNANSIMVKEALEQVHIKAYYNESKILFVVWPGSPVAGTEGWEIGDPE